MTVKDIARDALEHASDSVSLEELIDDMRLRQSLEISRQQSECGDTISLEQARKNFTEWSKIFTVDITNQAYQQIEEICDYIAQDDPIRAISFGDELLAEAESLSHDPYRGRPYQSEGTGLRLLSHGNYLMFYKVFEESQVIELWSVWHGARKPPTF